jgi:MATE family multidrug resistance protein
VRRIGTLGDVPLRATTMAINFNMIAFIPLIGVSIAASVLVGRHLTETGPDRAAKSVAAAMAIGWVYSSLWMIAFLTIGDLMFSLYEFNSDGADSALAIQISRGLLGFVAIYVVLDATQLILAGALRGAGDTWFVLFGGIAASAIALSIGFAFEPSGDATDFNVGLNWWWTVLTLWVCLLAVMMAIRFATGQWRKMRMVD